MLLPELRVRRPRPDLLAVEGTLGVESEESAESRVAELEVRRLPCTSYRSEGGVWSSSVATLGGGCCCTRAARAPPAASAPLLLLLLLLMRAPMTGLLRERLVGRV